MYVPLRNRWRARSALSVNMSATVHIRAILDPKTLFTSILIINYAEICIGTLQIAVDVTLQFVTSYVGIYTFHKCPVLMSKRVINAKN